MRQSADSAKSTKSAKSAESAKSTESAKPSGSAKSAESAKSQKVTSDLNRTYSGSRWDYVYYDDYKSNKPPTGKMEVTDCGKEKKEHLVIDMNPDYEYNENLANHKCLSKDEPKKKRSESRTDKLIPAGRKFTSAEILNGRADQVGWLWRKERMFRSRERYWALLYHKVIYLYLDSKDKEEYEKIELKQGAAVRLQRNKSCFVISLSNPSGKHDFQAVDTNTADSWIKIIQTKILK